jgi:hypothetical protein
VHLATSLARFVGSTAYDLGQLRDDLERFTFLLGGPRSLAFPGVPRQPSRIPGDRETRRVTWPFTACFAAANWAQ